MLLSGELTSGIKRTFLRPHAYTRPPHTSVQCQFFYLSPVLVQPTKGRILTQREKEIKHTAEQRALPTQVVAQAGQLRIRVTGNMISGNVWMKGYDLIEHSYVEYTASFVGEMATRLKPKWQTREPVRTTGTFGTQPLKFK
jgi:hypothetical protein